jgi:predicted dehydrogenase
MTTQTSATRYGLETLLDVTPTSAPALAYQPPLPRSYFPKIGLIGCGHVTGYHLKAYRAMQLDVAVLCDRDRARAEQRRAEFYPNAAVTTDAEDVLRRSDIPVVDIATHPAERVALIEAALRAGKHVLSQKPFVLDVQSGRHLVALAEAQGVKLAVNQNARWAPHYSYMAAAVSSGLIGDVASVDFLLHWDHTWTAGTPFDDVHHLVLFDYAIHWFDMTVRFMPGHRPERVTASIRRLREQKVKPPMLAHVSIDYPNAQVRFGFNGHVIHGQEDRTIVCGNRGAIRSFGPSLSDQAVQLHTPEGEFRPKLEGNWFVDGFRGTMGELLCAIEDDREPSNSARDNLMSLELCFAAVASADTGLPVAPGTVTKLSA